MSILKETWVPHGRGHGEGHSIQQQPLIYPRTRQQFEDEFRDPIVVRLVGDLTSVDIGQEFEALASAVRRAKLFP